jgi:hypothetical protein
MVKIISAHKDENRWWIHYKNGCEYIVGYRHALESASQSPISPEEDMVCALCEKLYPPATTGG